MDRVKKLTTGVIADDFGVEKALLAAFSPFECLADTVNRGSALAQAMTRWVRFGKRTDEGGEASRLISYVWSADVIRPASLMLNLREVGLKTPTSRTWIRLIRTRGEEHLIEVDFGTEGSMSLATQILRRAEWRDVMFDVYGDRLIDRKIVLWHLLRQVEEEIGRLGGRTRAMDRAAQERDLIRRKLAPMDRD